MTAMLDRVPVERITAEAREVHFVRTVLALLAGLFYALGWAVAKFWLALAWAGTAIKIGWMDARKSTAADRGAA